ncbi:sensor histidine kinase [Rugosimonospora africana]|uniref:histidine kinase n=1 Tax=Rugosimonospora africana TaxID=556532 RepID=A0A8J3QVE0_9ACTN|nr:nitrate- and nitrite sensing domain-containing protein [Rugosimonospora africana]GIH17538.1 ATPase [Rugosimonospora africana]
MGNTPPERGPGQRSGTIRGRLARILALPMVAVLVLLGVVVAGNVSDYRAATRTTGSVAVELQLQILAGELQQERGLTSGLLGGDIGFGAELDRERKQVDGQRDRVNGLATGDGQGLADVRAALAELDGLSGIRAQVDARRATRSAAFQFYTARIATLNSVDLGLGDSADRTLRRGIAALAALGQIQEYLTQERAFLNGVFSAGGFQRGEYAQFVGMYAGLQQAEQQFGLSATPAQIAVAQAVQSSGPYSEAQTFETRALASADGRPLLVDPQSWWSALTPVLDELVGLEHSAGADITHRAQALQSDATRRLVALGGLVVLCLLGAVALVIAAARSITGPLAALAAEAEALASRRLPDAVARVQTGTEEEQPVAPPPLRVATRASSEIRSVAAALERVQATAFTLATEQALLRRNTTESLANLGRRNQNLLRRQLGFITRLESEETDPSGLANLFELDHLATRMRRNAESLLVLVGEATPRTWAGAMPVADVVRAAISEVEEYRRVTLRRIDDAYIAGAYVTGVAHMVAELVENGLTFSPPDVDVEIQGRQIGNQYLIAITDQGVGMEAADLASANARLRGEEHFLMAPARFLGHYVVGQLARQMSVDVQLSPSPVTGVTARVVLPARVLAPAPGIASSPSGGNGTGERPIVTAGSTVDGARPPIGSSAAAARPAIGLRPRPRVEYGTAMRPDSGPVDVPTVGFPAVGAPPVDFPDVEVLTATGSTAGHAEEDDVDRTRNGLLKRPRRARVERAEPTAVLPRVGGVADAVEPPRPAALDESPAQVRNRLVSLRAGVQRGESERHGNGEERV